MWRNAPTGRHEKGGSLAFADGHTEHWRWAALPDELGSDVLTTPATVPDMIELNNAIFWP